MVDAPKPGAHRKQAEADRGVTLTVNGNDYTLHPDRLTARDVAELRRATGSLWGAPMGLGQLMYAAENGGDIDTIAVLLWFARKVGGESDLTLDAVLDEITYESIEDLDLDAGEDEQSDDGVDVLEADDPLGSSAGRSDTDSPASPASSASAGAT